jgi:hypothetical protein
MLYKDFIRHLVRWALTFLNNFDARWVLIWGRFSEENGRSRCNPEEVTHGIV